MGSEVQELCSCIEIDASGLPALPDLPSELVTVALTHKSYALAQQGPRPNSEECELLCYNRSETLGDAVLYMFVTDWLISNHSTIDSGTATGIRTLIINNNTLARLSRHYKLHERAYLALDLDKQPTGELHKIHADLYEAYIGAIWQACKKGQLPFDTLSTYFASLFGSDGAFPDLEKRIAAHQERKMAKRKAGQSRRAAKRHRNE